MNQYGHYNGRDPARELRTLDVEIQRLVAAINALQVGMAPIGSRVTWEDTITGVPPLPAGWVECLAQVLDDPLSPLNGQTMPDVAGDIIRVR